MDRPGRAIKRDAADGGTPESGAARMSDIETAKPRDRLVDHHADVIVLADVGVDELGLGTERAQLLNERLAGLITPAGNDHLRALLGEGDGGGATDAGKSTGDQDNLIAHIRILSWAAGNRQRCRPDAAVVQSLPPA